MSTTQGPAPPAAPGPSTGRLVVIVVGVVFGIVLLTAAGLGIAGFIFASKVHVTHVTGENGEEKGVKIDTPLGRVRVEKGRDVDPKSLDLPIYPGAKVIERDMGARVDLDLDFADKSLQVLVVKLETADPFSKVVDFYKDAATDFAFVRKSGDHVVFHCERSGLKKVVAIEDRHGATRIVLANIGEPEAN